MARKLPSYRSLSTPSQILLVLFVVLGLYFTYSLFKQANGYLASRAELERMRARYEALLSKQGRLLDVSDSIERELEERVREGLGARYGETVLLAPPEYDDSTVLMREWIADQPAWRQWLDLFFRQQ